MARRGLRVQADEVDHLNEEVSAPTDLSNVIETGVEVAAGDHSWQMTGNFVHQVEPDWSGEGVSFLEVNAGDGQVRHPLLRLVQRLILLDLIHDFRDQRQNEFLKWYLFDSHQNYGIKIGTIFCDF